MLGIMGTALSGTELRYWTHVTTSGVMQMGEESSPHQIDDTYLQDQQG